LGTHRKPKPPVHRQALVTTAAAGVIVTGIPIVGNSGAAEQSVANVPVAGTAAPTETTAVAYERFLVEAENEVRQRTNQRDREQRPASRGRHARPQSAEERTPQAKAKATPRATPKAAPKAAPRAKTIPKATAAPTAKATPRRAAPKKAAPAPRPARVSRPTTTTPAGSPKTIARKLVGNSTQFACFDKIIQRESSWNPRATNPSSGAYGLPQALPARKMASAGADWRTNPTTQIRWAISYMEDRYGSPCGAWRFWQSRHWY
jgi:hypothetical protein